MSEPYKENNVLSQSRKHLAYALRLKSELLPKIEGCPHLQDWLDSFAALVASLGRKKRERLEKRRIKTAAEMLELLHGETGYKLWPWVGYVLADGELTEERCHTLAAHLRSENACAINSVMAWFAPPRPVRHVADYDDVFTVADELEVIKEKLRSPGAW